MEMFRSSVRGLQASSARRRSSAAHAVDVEEGNEENQRGLHGMRSPQHEAKNVHYTEKDWERDQDDRYDPPIPPIRTSHCGRGRKLSDLGNEAEWRASRDMEEGRNRSKGVGPEDFQMQGGIFSQLLKLSAIPPTLPQPGSIPTSGPSRPPPPIPTLQSLGIGRSNSLFNRDDDDMELDSEDPRITGVVPRRNARSGEGVYMKMFAGDEKAAEEYQRQEIHRQVAGTSLSHLAKT